MLNPFPDFLMYGFFAPTLLRIAAAMALFYIAYSIMTNRDKLAELKVPIIGHYRPWMAIISGAVTTLVALSLFVGYLTQIGAILGAVIGLKQAIFAKRYASATPLSRGANLLLMAICLSLLVSGAGALAQDLPL
jgi:uncharacterized membrane protein YphA (DoxX/SURF4 family)